MNSSQSDTDRRSVVRLHYRSPRPLGISVSSRVPDEARHTRRRRPVSPTAAKQLLAVQDVAIWNAGTDILLLLLLGRTLSIIHFNNALDV